MCVAGIVGGETTLAVLGLAFLKKRVYSAPVRGLLKLTTGVLRAACILSSTRREAVELASRPLRTEALIGRTPIKVLRGSQIDVLPLDTIANE
jgi:hypothetical protein